MAAIREKMTANVAPYLEPGEKIQSIFGAQTVTQYLALVSLWLIVFKNAYRVVVATDKRILILQAGRFSQTQIKGVLAEVPRNTTIGPASGLWYKTEALGPRLYIGKRFHKDVEAADKLVKTA